MKWKWKGEFPLSNRTTVREVNVADGRAYVVIGSYGTRYDWFVMDLGGVESGMSGWVQITRAGGVSPELRSSEHFQKMSGPINPGYIAEKFPGATRTEYVEMAHLMIPFLTDVLDMDPLGQGVLDWQPH